MSKLALTKVVARISVGKSVDASYQTLNERHDVIRPARLDDKQAAIVVAWGESSALRAIAMP